MRKETNGLMVAEVSRLCFFGAPIETLGEFRYNQFSNGRSTKKKCKRGNLDVFRLHTGFTWFRREELLLDFEFGIDCIVVARALFRFTGRSRLRLSTQSRPERLCRLIQFHRGRFDRRGIVG